MIECSRDGCSWQAIAPSEEAAWSQYAAHLVEFVQQHAEEAHDTEMSASDVRGAWKTV
jgi:hypothetical protein